MCKKVIRVLKVVYSERYICRDSFSYELSKNANHLDRSVLTDVFQFNCDTLLPIEFALSSRRMFTV